MGPVYLRDCPRIHDEHCCQPTEVSIALTLVYAENRPFPTWLVAEQEQAAKGEEGCQPYYLLLHLHAVLGPCLLLSPICEKSPHQRQQDAWMQKEATERTVLAVTVVSMWLVGT